MSLVVSYTPMNRLTRLGYADGADTFSLDAAGEPVEEKELQYEQTKHV